MTPETKENILAKIESSLEGIRPFLNADGGDVRLLDIGEDMVVRIELQGSCKDCQMSEMTMKAGIEQSIRGVLPEVKGLVAVTPAS